MLFLNGKDIIRAGRNTIQDAVKQAYQLVLDNAYHMPDRMHVANGDNTLLLMPCFGQDFFATKLVSVFPGAPDKGLPAVNGVVVLSDNATGKPLAVMDGAALTAERTGAVGGLATAYLTPEKIQTAGIIGAGVQARSQARYLLLNRPVSEVFICSLSPENAAAMARELAKEYPDIKFTVADHPESLVKASDVIISATTSKTPVFPSDSDLVRHKTFISVGSFTPEMKEFPDAVIENSDYIYADTLFAAQESGDLCIPIEKGQMEAGKILPFAKLLTTRPDLKDKTVLFKSVGMALFDMATAAAVYQKALKEGFGQQLIH